MKRTIWFDMDGTIADLYGVDAWLSKLNIFDPSPYIEAEVMHNMSMLARYLNKLQQLGYQIGIISWLAKHSTREYDKAVANAKREWLEVHLHSVRFDYINIIPYGFPKETFMKTSDDILFDDNPDIRNEWDGDAYKPSEIMKILKALAAEG